MSRSIHGWRPTYQQASPARPEPLWQLLAQVIGSAVVVAIVTYFLLIALTSGARP